MTSFPYLLRYRSWIVFSNAFENQNLYFEFEVDTGLEHNQKDTRQAENNDKSNKTQNQHMVAPVQ
jgi:hypothetical protein